jgi:glycerol-3-phosphate acyltransferase PlsY
MLQSAMFWTVIGFAMGSIPFSYRFGIAGWTVVPVALAPVLGHAFSPFLRLRGGKAIAATFGVWTALTLWEGPTVLGLSVGIFHRLQAVDGWTVMLGMATWLCCLLLGGVATPPFVVGPSGPLLAVWCGNMAVLIWKHRQELRRPPQLRPWLRRLLLRLGVLLARRRDA